MLRFEQEAWSMGFRDVAGIDEAGRGPLAGPVVAAAVVFEKGFVERESERVLKGLTDSKKLKQSVRESFYDILNDSPHVYIGVSAVNASEIDSLNILQATRAAMIRALENLGKPVGMALIDGRPMRSFPGHCRAVVRGDSLSLSIASASVIAKVTRDRLMSGLDQTYPEYGFRQNKGYGTAAHIKALNKHGPCPEHRRSFAPVRAACRLKESIAAACSTDSGM